MTEKQRQKIITAIKNHPQILDGLNSDEQKILKKRYVEFLPWADIAKDLSYCNETVFYKHRVAVKKVIKKL